ncbi:unnamed protein product [Paramecium octaurelia]|uniref:Uncharacterized protein n=1 Tax=Paramecium octaurelia TaxID=43137 RepID=A0A8S1U0Y6_PAROT|nr:unnamed protein product [Paramecium octaurelia]
MNSQISKTYNKISDVFSRTQIKQAVEGLSTCRQRLKLIDHIIHRREQIKKSENVAKLQQYAHIFKMMMNKYKKKKNDQEQQKKQQKLEMVMQLLSGEKNKKQDVKEDSRVILRYCQIGNNKLFLQQSIRELQHHQQRLMIQKLNRVHKLNKESYQDFLLKGILQRGISILEKNKELNYLQKERFLRLTNENKKFQYLENQIKKQLKQQEYQQQQTAVKQYYRVQNLFHKNYFKGASIKIIKTQKTYPFRLADDHCKTESQQFQEQESFASYTEIKLNQLYTDSIGAQKSLRQNINPAQIVCFNHIQLAQMQIQQRFRIKKCFRQENYKNEYVSYLQRSFYRCYKQNEIIIFEKYKFQEYYIYKIGYLQYLSQQFFQQRLLQM